MFQRDPFQSAPVSTAYVARPAADTALASLLASTRSGARPAALVGPAGVGKTFLLQMLAERCQPELECVRVPVPSLTSDELYGWVRARRGLSLVASPQEQLTCEIRLAAEDGYPLLIAIDDAGLLPDATAESLFELHGKLKPALRLVLAVRADDAGERILERFGSDIEQVRFDRPMTSEETAAYVRAKIASGSLSEDARAYLDAERIEELQEHTGGIPARVNELAGAFLRVDPDGRVEQGPVESHSESLAFALLREVESEQRVGEWASEPLGQVTTSRAPSFPDLLAPSGEDLNESIVAPASALLSRPEMSPPPPALEEPLPEYPDLLVTEPGEGLGGRIAEALGQEPGAGPADGQGDFAAEGAGGMFFGALDEAGDLEDREEALSEGDEADGLADRIFEVLTRESGGTAPLASEEGEEDGEAANQILGCLRMPDLAPDEEIGEDVSSRFAALCEGDEIDGVGASTGSADLSDLSYDAADMPLPGADLWAGVACDMTQGLVDSAPVSDLDRVVEPPSALLSDRESPAPAALGTDEPWQEKAMEADAAGAWRAPSLALAAGVVLMLTAGVVLSRADFGTESAVVAPVVEVVAPVEVAEVAPVAAVVEVVAPVEVAEVAPVAAVVEVVAPMAEALALDASVAAGAGGMIPEEVAGPVGSREQRLADWYRRRTGPAMPSAVIGQIQERGPIGMEAPASTESVQPRPSGAKIDAGAEQSRAIAGAKPPAALAAPVSPALLLPVTVRAARGSRIEIDGADRGNAPLFGLLLSQGVHRVAETSSQGVRVEVEFDVHDENLTLDFTRANAIDTGDVSDSGAGDEPLRMDEDANDQRAQHDAAGQDDAA